MKNTKLRNSAISTKDQFLTMVLCRHQRRLLYDIKVTSGPRSACFPSRLTYKVLLFFIVLQSDITLCLSLGLSLVSYLFMMDTGSSRIKERTMGRYPSPAVGNEVSLRELNIFILRAVFESVAKYEVR